MFLNFLFNVLATKALFNLLSSSSQTIYNVQIYEMFFNFYFWLNLRKSMLVDTKSLFFNEIKQI